MRSGSKAAYHSVAELAGEKRVVRADLATGDATRRGTLIASLAQLTDLHVTDAQSPARFEFMNHEARDPRFRELLTMQRPNEMLNTHAIAALVRAINEIDSVELVAVTGDGIDNTQHNELANFFALLDGGVVHPDSGAPGYEGVQRADWPDEIFWKPDGTPDGDAFQRDLGFPRRPGLLDEAMQAHVSEGLRVPWLRCYGNHEQLCQGVGVVNPSLAAAMAGSRKPIALPADVDRDHVVDTFVNRPEYFTSGATLPVSADPRRRSIRRSDVMPEADYVHDAGMVRYITLDTVCDAGGADGTVDLAQLQWLEARLVEARDRYVVLLSHHGSDTLSNPRGESRADELLALLQRFPNVVLWLNGHIHANRIRPKGTFWEVTTCSVVDWPCQARLVELYRTAGHLVVACSMVDHDGQGLAGLHRELAGNMAFGGFASWREGQAGDRNPLLLLPDPL